MYPSFPESNPTLTNATDPSIDSSAGISPSKWWYFVAGGLFLVSIISAIVAIVGVVAFIDDIEDFRDPQTLTITTDRAVSRDIWTSSASRRVTVVAIRLDDGPLPIVSEYNSSTAITLNEKEWSNIGSVDFPGPGQYVVSASPAGVEIALAPAGRYTPIGIWSTIAGVAAIAAFVVWLLTMIRRRKAKLALVPDYRQPQQSPYGTDQYGTGQYLDPQASGQAPPLDGSRGPDSAPYPPAQPPVVQYHKPGQAPQQVQTSQYHQAGQAPHRVGPPPPPTQPQWPAAPPEAPPSSSLPDTPTIDSGGHEAGSAGDSEPDAAKESADQARERRQRSKPRATVQPKPAPDPFNQHRKPLPKSPIENEPSNDGPISKG